MSSKRSALDLETEWAGTYTGLEHGVALTPSDPILKENEITLVISKIQPGYYSQTVNGKNRGSGVAYIDPNGVPVLQFIEPNGEPNFKYAIELGKNNEVKKIKAPVLLSNFRYSGIGFLRRSSKN